MSVRQFLQPAQQIYRVSCINAPFRRTFNTSSIRLNIQQKYTEKLTKVAQEKGVSVDELRSEIRKTKAKPEPIPEAKKFASNLKKDSKPASGGAAPSLENVRRDNSPVKPLAELLNLQKILSSPHTPEQISALWNLYHAAKSKSGRGYLSASIPLEKYTPMEAKGKRFPNFILPLRRSSSGEASDDQDAFEFYFLQWTFHPPPMLPKPTILDPTPSHPQPPSQIPISTVLLTPLLEYKTRQTFATPHLVLTHYTDLAKSHKLVLFRGELTPTPSGGGNFWLSQEDAQLLALGVQRFYLTEVDGNEKGAQGRKERAEILKNFNENPEQFRWEDLLKHVDPTTP
ncbi:ATP11-domain-containing protein [Schizopora paradoxa]|uniref:ATP11-domain-containing protein n=1 Tax=Schizopora paradoxa TaxID=27342 RepID=A0A0H2S0T2_9AGAM|nr:ATP11-domain-containing protein [Schizopora paradoxa]